MDNSLPCLPPRYVVKIGEALEMNNNSVPCIGFCSYGCLPDTVMEELTHATSQQSVTYPYQEAGTAVPSFNADHVIVDWT